MTPIEALIARWQAHADALPPSPYRDTLQRQITALRAAYTVERDEQRQACADCQLCKAPAWIESEAAHD